MRPLSEVLDALEAPGETLAPLGEAKRSSSAGAKKAKKALDPAAVAKRVAVIAGLKTVRIPVGEDIDALGPTAVDVWVAFATATYSDPRVQSGKLATIVGCSTETVRQYLHAFAELGLVRQNGRYWHRLWMLRDLSGFGDKKTKKRHKGKFRRYTWRTVSDICPESRTTRRVPQVLANIRGAVKAMTGKAVKRALLARWCGCSVASIARALAALTAQKRIKRRATRSGVYFTLLDTT